MFTDAEHFALTCLSFHCNNYCSDCCVCANFNVCIFSEILTAQIPLILVPNFCNMNKTILGLGMIVNHMLFSICVIINSGRNVINFIYWETTIC